MKYVSLMINKLLQTDGDYIYLFLRIVAGIIIFPYGMQKLFGWFDDLGGGVGNKETIKQMRFDHTWSIAGKHRFNTGLPGKSSCSSEFYHFRRSPYCSFS